MRNCILNSKPMGLLFACFIFFSCLNEEYKNSRTSGPSDNYQSDSLKIIIDVKGKGYGGLTYKNRLLRNELLEFKNDEDDTLKVTYKIPKVFAALEFYYQFFVYENKELIRGEQSFIVQRDVDSVVFIYDTNTHLFEENSYMVLAPLHNDYEKISININKKDKLETISTLDSLYLSYKQKYLQTNKTLAILNKIYYVDLLQKIKPNDSFIEEFLTELNEPIASRSLNSLLFNYTKNRIFDLNYSALEKSASYSHLISLGHLGYLSIEDNKGKAQFQKAIAWLHSTELYKNNIEIIDKMISPINNEQFKVYLSQLSLLDLKNNPSLIETIQKDFPSDYYLLDFWATWCKPCIDGIKRMEQMDIPKNISIISLSIDKDEQRKKWQTMTQELNQNISFLIPENDNMNKEFLQFVKLQSIPRYILIDKNLNLIDEAFYHPQEPQFLPKLKDIKNYKNW